MTADTAEALAAKVGEYRVMKLWSGKGRRTAKWNAVSCALKGINITTGGARTRIRRRPQAEANPERIIDFETLLSWYYKNNAPAAVGDEFSQARMYAAKRKNLKFL